MTKTKRSRKTIKRADSKSVSYRLTDDEHRPIDLDLKRENSTGRPQITLAAYAKHALLFYRPLNQVVADLIAFKAQLAARDDGSDAVPRGWIVEQIGKVLGERFLPR